MLSLILGCTEIRTSNPEEAFKHWLGTDVPENHVKVINAKYWESAHWSKEYIIFIELEVSDKWWEKFIEINQLSVSIEKDHHVPENRPYWFIPSVNSSLWRKNNDFNQSKFFFDSSSNKLLVYEIQL